MKTMMGVGVVGVGEVVVVVVVGQGIGTQGEERVGQKNRQKIELVV